MMLITVGTLPFFLLEWSGTPLPDVLPESFYLSIPYPAVSVSYLVFLTLRNQV